MSNLLEFYCINLVSFYKLKNLPRPKAGTVSAEVHALIESPATAVDGEQWKEGEAAYKQVLRSKWGFLPHWSQQTDKKFWTDWRHVLSTVWILPAALLQIQEVWEVQLCISGHFEESLCLQLQGLAVCFDSSVLNMKALQYVETSGYARSHPTINRHIQEQLNSSWTVWLLK